MDKGLLKNMKFDIGEAVSLIDIDTIYVYVGKNQIGNIFSKAKDDPTEFAGMKTGKNKSNLTKRVILPKKIEYELMIKKWVKKEIAKATIDKSESFNPIVLEKMLVMEVTRSGVCEEMTQEWDLIRKIKKVISEELSIRRKEWRAISDFQISQLPF